MAQLTTSPATRVPVVDVIRDAIRQRLIAPGAPLVQSALADALGVSKIPIREALHTLASEGLVTFAEDGAHVTLLSPGEIHELWTLRSAVEPLLAEAIVRRLGPADREALAQLVAAMDSAEGDAWSDLNYVFHTELYRLSGMAHTAAMATRLLTRLEPYSRTAVNLLAGRPAAQAEHHEMLAALDARDAAALREVIERHSTRVRDLLMADAAAQAAPPGRSAAAAEAARGLAERLGSS
ncbi:MAG: GntR family transcriptional regulator [Thermoleophilia bacterium]